MNGYLKLRFLKIVLYFRSENFGFDDIDFIYLFRFAILKFKFLFSF